MVKLLNLILGINAKKNTSPRNFRYILEKNGKQKEKIGNHYEFPFLVVFYKYLILRNSCYSCKYANMKRVGDLTLGDYWEAKDKFGKDKGISMIVVNTQKGQTFLNRINKNLFLKEEDIKLIKNGNETFNRPTKKPNNRKEYLNMYNDNFNEVVDTFLKVKHKQILDIYYGMPNHIKLIIKRILDSKILNKFW